MRIVGALVLCLVVHALADDPDKIINLPNLPVGMDFAQYAGYVTVDASHNRRLFYWFLESQKDPSSDPVVLWLNGGPGCSSLGGLLSENGPFIPTADGTLASNPHSWNTAANMIYLESPAGVGFSYSNVTSDYTVGDKRTADDAYIFLQAFFTKFPHFQGRQFWVSGESYGGHYVPDLTLRIVEGNKDPSNIKINIQGFMVGNAWTVAELDNKGCVFDWWSHALNSESTYKGLMDNCDFPNIGPLSAVAEKEANACDSFLKISSQEMGNINIYQIYADVCLSSANQAIHLMRTIASSSEKHATSLLARRLVEKHDTLMDSGLFPPCLDQYVAKYLNRPDVKSAIHAEKSIKWQGCSSLVKYSYSDLLSSMIPIYNQLISENLNLLVYSGDVDGIVPTTGTRNWLPLLNLTISEPWRPWTDSSKQVGGYVEQYDGLTFATVREAGHMVPGTQPQRALDLFTRFLKQTPL